MDMNVLSCRYIKNPRFVIAFSYLEYYVSYKTRQDKKVICTIYKNFTFVKEELFI